MMSLLFGLISVLSTTTGGLLAVKFRSKLHLITSFSAGVLLGLIMFDLMPEIFSVVSTNAINPAIPMGILIFAFFGFHILEKLTATHSSHEDEYAGHHHHHVGTVSALALAAHSFTDGLGIGIGFQISPQIGIIIAIAVIAHDFTDGINTIALTLKSNHSVKNAIRFLVLDAVAPIFGVFAALFFVLPEIYIMYYISAFAGFLLYISTSDILPSAHTSTSARWPILLTVLGTLVMFGITQLINLSF